MRDGYGTTTHKSGLKFVGYWRNDKLDGKGTEIKPNGLVIEGIWRNGALLESFNDAQEDVADIHPAYQKKKLAIDMDELMEKVHASRAGYQQATEKEVLENIEEVHSKKIEPYHAKFEESEIIDYLRDLSKIVVFHSLYAISNKVYSKIEPFDFQDPDYPKKKVKFHNEWNPFGNDGAVYKGERDKKKALQGRGVLLHKGRIFQGFFINQKKNGLGREILPDGTIYEGYWSNDMKNGFNVERNLNGSMYIGDWEDDKRNGLGIMITKEWRYEGKWKNDLQEGSGEIFYKDNSKYKGEFHLGLPHGYGCLTEKNNKSIAGLWENGKMLRKNNDKHKELSDTSSKINNTFTMPNEFSINSKISDESSSQIPVEISYYRAEQSELVNYNAELEEIRLNIISNANSEIINKDSFRSSSRDQDLSNLSGVSREIKTEISLMK